MVRVFALALLLASTPIAAQTDVEALAGRIEAAQAKRDWAQVVSLGKEALAAEEAELGPDHIETAGTRKLIAKALIELNRYGEAEQLLLQALPIFEKDLGDDDDEAVDAANSLATAIEAQGRFADASRIHDLTLKIVQQRYGSRHKNTAKAINNLAYNLARQGKFREAQTRYDTALALARSTMDEEDADLALIQTNVAANMTARGQYLRAEPLYEQALAIRSALLGPDHPDVATSYNGLAFNLSAQGRHEEAAPLYARALAIREKAGMNDSRTATGFNNVAHNLNVRGRPLEAAPLYAKALSIWRGLYGEQHRLTAIGISNVAANLEAQGKFAEAQPLFAQALAIRQRILSPNDPDLATAWFKIAHNLRLQNKLDQAEEGYRRAIAIRRQSLGNLHPELALALAEQAELALRQGPSKTGDAIARAREAASIARKRREQRLTGESAGDGDDAQALARVQGADLNRADPLARTFGTLVEALWARGEAGGDAALRSEAFEAAQDLETSVAALTMAQTAARTAAGTGPLTQAVREQQDLSARAFELDKRLLSALGAGDQTEPTRLRAQIATVAELLSQADARLRREFPDYAELVQPRALPAAATQSRLAADEGLLFLAPVGDDIFAFGLSRERLVWNRAAGGAAEATRIVRNLRCQIDPQTCGKDGNDEILDAGAKPNSRFLLDGYQAYNRAAAHKLYKDLIAPVEGAFSGKARLYVVAAGAMGALPLGVLVTDPPDPAEDGADPKVMAATPWFADRYALIALPSVSVLRALKRVPAATADRISFLGYGAPVLEGKKPGARANAMAARLFKSVDEGGAALADPAALRALDPLPGTARELSAMAETLDAVPGSVTTGPAATESAVRADPRLARARIVAFATHGVLPQEVSGIEEPGLVMTPPSQASGGDDGLLAASEVARLSLAADWVLLSACNTAAGDGTPGADSLSSLARAFLYAGASALLASHWRVSDEATARLTVEALAGRAKSGLSRAEALQRAMKAIRTGKRADGSAVERWDDSWSHPSAWGAFTVISNTDE